VKKRLTIVIPAYNEEKILPKLLISIKKQRLEEIEIFVADADSTDKTKEIARKFGARVVKGGLPAKGRNFGASFSKADMLLFLDADTILPEGFLEKNLLEFEKRKLDLAGVDLLPEIYKRSHLLSHKIYNRWQRMMQKLDPHLSGACIFIKKEVFFDLGGFKENLLVAEDHALARKSKRKGYRFGILSVPINISTRRLEKEGQISFSLKLFYFWFKRIFGEIEKSKIKYDLRDR
jgi:glycosyltransferase involved in cell wall biosynthesis